MQKTAGPTQSSTMPMFFQERIHYWFIHYNPLFFCSAFCVIVGIFLISLDLNDMRAHGGEIILTGVIEAYQMLLLGGATLLFRKAKQYRPAVILGIIVLVFLFDCTNQTKLIALEKGWGIFLSVFWVALFGLKLSLVLRIFNLKVPVQLFTAVITTAATLAFMPHILGAATISKEKMLLTALWIGVGAFFAASRYQAQVECKTELDEWGKTVLFRTVRNIVFVWSALYLYHLMMFFRLLDIPLSFYYAAPFFMLRAVMSHKEDWVWAGSLCAIACSFAPPANIFLTCLIAVIVFLIKVIQLNHNRMYFGCVISAYIAIYMIGWTPSSSLPDPPLWLTIVAGQILILMAWFSKLTLGYVLFLFGMIWTYNPFMRHSLYDWGVFLLILGFQSLIAGVAINWRLKDTPNRIETPIGCHVAPYPDYSVTGLE